MGLFWENEVVVRTKKVKEKRQPPEPVWLNAEYLPNYEEAVTTIYDEMTDAEILQAQANNDVLLLDIESYSNYLLIGFESHQTGKIITFELSQYVNTMNREKLLWLMNNFVTTGFNSLNFDNTLIILALAGLDMYTIKHGVNMMIEQEMWASDVIKHFGIDKESLGITYWKHIDLMNVAPKRASLKKYSGRLHIERIQDLPFAPDTALTQAQQAIVKWYWRNDMASTRLLFDALNERIALRSAMSQQYGLDLMSKSDPQIAEAIFVSEAKKLNGGQRIFKPSLSEYMNKSFKYRKPYFIKYQSNVMNEVLKIVNDSDFYVNEKGAVVCPKLKGLKFKINQTLYTMGIGGLHSNEKSQYYVASEEYELEDHDVASYYPRIILELGMFPKSIGQAFISIYQKITNDRLKAKRDKNKVVNESLKIVINGSFGKFGSLYSYLFAPQLLIQTTLTGQLSLLMLIERLEIAGIRVISANTDGLVTYTHKSQKELLRSILDQWQKDTGFELEDAMYKGLFSRDVNNYFAVKEDGEIKGKGIFAGSNIELDPDFEIISQAVIEYCTTGKSIDNVVNECEDLSKFIKVVSVTGGAVKNGEYLGKVIRFYKSKNANGEIIYAKSGNKVSLSDNGEPVMKYPKQFPTDVDKEWYIKEAYALLENIGVK